MSATETGKRYFDLNIQRVLEHWTVSEALREIIANALDEASLTNTAERFQRKRRSALRLRFFEPGSQPCRQQIRNTRPRVNRLSPVEITNLSS